MRDRVLIVDDDPSLCTFVAEGLAKADLDTATRNSAEDAILELKERDYQMVLSDLQLGAMDGIALCQWVVANRPHIPVVVMTAFGTMDAAVSALRAGAQDFVAKPIRMEALTLTLSRVLAHQRLTEEVKRLRSITSRAEADVEMGSSPAIKQVFELLNRVADTDASVLITGESGTGKEVVARALHARSRRSSGPFVPVNCAAVPEPLLESELFGHAKGAFTDAKTPRMGLFQRASGGTLFLDEIGDMPLGLQPKLLRALQEKRVRPVGGDNDIPFDARLVTATNVDIETAVAEKRFREDLYFRVNVIHVALPPLRARGADILLLAQRFIDRVSLETGRNVKSLSPAAAKKIMAYPWPGNVRELQNCIERAVALADHDQIMVDELPPKVREHRSSLVVVAADDPTDLVPLKTVETRYIRQVLQAVGGNKSLAARVLQLDRKTLHRKLERDDEE